jgi:hypothetical protein
MRAYWYMSAHIAKREPQFRERPPAELEMPNGWHDNACRIVGLRFGLASSRVAPG